LIVALDNTFLTLILNEQSEPRTGPTGQPTAFWKERVESMIDSHSANGDTILIPTPCLAEVLMAVPSIARAIEVIKTSTSMQIASFDAKAAVELGIESAKARSSGDKKSGSAADWQKVKFDRQISMIAKTSGAEVIYTDDDNQTHFSKLIGLKVVHTWELPLPPQIVQPSFLDDKQ
jgi:predicted nucleic acid-binding protein